MPPITEPLIYVARPTLRLNGEDNERLSSLVTSLVMNEQDGGLSSLEVRVSNSASLSSGAAEYAFDAGGTLRLGAEIVVGAGDSASPVEIFRGVVSGLEGVFSGEAPPELIVLAEDALQKFRCVRRTRTFEDQSIAEIVRTIAGDHGLTPVIDGLDQNFGTQVQLNETDLGFLRRLLARVDGDLQVVGTDLQVAPRGNVSRGQLEYTLGVELKSARVLADLAHQITAATARGWDISAGSELNKDGEENALGPGAGRKGGEVISEVWGERKYHSCYLFSDRQAEVDEIANTVRRRRARRFLRVQGVTTGTPELRVGTHVRLTGLGDWFSNTYYVTSARHLFDHENGYRTEFDGQCAYLGEAP